MDGRKYWWMRYWQTGKEKSLSLGVYPKVSLSDTRKKRDELRQQLQADLDPLRPAQSRKPAEKVCRGKLFRSCSPRAWYAKQLHTWVPHHASDVRRRLEGNIFPTIGKRPISQIEAPELLEAIRRIEALTHTTLRIASCKYAAGVPLWHCYRALLPYLSTHLRAH